MAAKRSTIELDRRPIQSIWFDRNLHLEIGHGVPKVVCFVAYTEPDGTPWIEVHRHGKGVTERIVASKLERVRYG